MTLSAEEWHQRFENQALWTQSLRSHLYNLTKIESAKRVIEIGCGSGAVLRELLHFTDADIYGLDINEDYLKLAMRNTQHSKLILADAHSLPITPDSIDFSFCHYLLMWVDDPLRVLQEMKRITRPGGCVCALAEPDYGGRIDFPKDLANLGNHQTKALMSQGANPEIGRQLRGLLTNVGLVEVVAGVLGGQWKLPFDREGWESEWKVLESDLVEVRDFQLNKNKQKAKDHLSWALGERILYVPTFYAWGRVPN